MDTTPKYIKMCEEAEEIQKLWQRQIGDFYTINCEYAYIYFGLNDSDMLWIPRQDQLQEMINTHYQTTLKILYEFSMHVSWSIRTFEKLWLAFVMKEKYNKIWDDKKEEWV